MTVSRVRPSFLLSRRYVGFAPIASIIKDAESVLHDPFYVDTYNSRIGRCGSAGESFASLVSTQAPKPFEIFTKLPLPWTFSDIFLELYTTCG